MTKFIQLILLCFAVSTTWADSQPIQNTLKNHSAPYLALHGDDPVAWQTWDQKTKDLANKENKILFLSIGYFSCHWCHVMQQESYQNEEIAKYINDNFIPVKIDRELEPALDRQLMNFTQRIIGRGGWPLNVFLTPTGHPIYSVLYAPSDQFLQLLLKINQVWVDDYEKVQQLISSEEITTFPNSEPALDDKAYSEIINNSPASIMARADRRYGGFGNDQKFPSTPQLHYLIQQFKNSNDKELAEFLTLSLDAMATKGLHDHVLGGFFRYTVDREWNIPHFEKMLYDNANLSHLYIEAGSVLNKPEYIGIGKLTLDFMLQFMWHEGNAFVSSFSAVDDENVEGGSYLWMPSEINSILEEDEAALILDVWNLDRKPELPAGNHPRFIKSLEQFAIDNNYALDQVKLLYESGLTKLRKARLKRSLPVDNKLLSGWNGLALSSLAKAATNFDEKRYIDAGNLLSQFLTKTLWDGESLSRAKTSDGLIGATSLEDYAYVAQGLVDWGTFVSSEETIQTAYDIVKQAWKKFYKNNGWARADQSMLATISTEEFLPDASSASPSSTIIRLSLELSERLDDEELRSKSLSALNRGSGYLSQAPFWYVTQLAAVKKGLELQKKSQ